MEFVPLLGYIPILGWAQSGGEIMTAVVEIVYRLEERGGAGAGPGHIVGCVKWRGREGRHKAGTYRELMGLAGRGWGNSFD